MRMADSNSIRRRFGAVRSVTLGTSVTPIVGPSESRVALLFTPSLAIADGLAVSGSAAVTGAVTIAQIASVPAGVYRARGAVWAQPGGTLGLNMALRHGPVDIYAALPSLGNSIIYPFEAQFGVSQGSTEAVSVVSLAADTGATYFASFSLQRVGVPYTVSTDPAVTGGAGLTILPENGPILLTLDDVGDAVKRAWYGISPYASTTIGFVETVCE